VFVVAVVAIANDVVNVGTIVDFQWSPFSFHTHPHPSANSPHPLETLCHVPF
jgi:hypothetical protein